MKLSPTANSSLSGPAAQRFRKGKGAAVGLPVYQSKRKMRGAIILGLFAGLTVVVGTTALTSYQVIRGLILDSLKQQALLSVKHGADEIDKWLGMRRAEVETLASSPVVNSVDWLTAAPYLNVEIQRLREFLLLGLAQPDGSLANTEIGVAPRNVGDRPWFQAGMSGRVSVNDPLVSRSTGIVIINVTAPIWADPSQPGGSPKGVLTGAISVDRVVQVVRMLQQGPGSYAFTLNSQGVPITHPNLDKVGTIEHPAPSLTESDNPYLKAIARSMVNRKQGIELVQMDGRWQYVAYTPLSQAPWSIAMVIPRENIESQLMALNLLAAVIGGLIIMALIGSWRQMQLFERARTRAAQEALLNRLTSHIRESLELETVVQTTVTELRALLNLQLVLFGWYDPKTQKFELVYGSPVEVVKSGTLFQLNAGDLPDCFRRGSSVRLESLDGFTPSIELNSLAYMALSVPAEDGCSGYLIGVDRYALDRADRELLQSVADQLAIAITQAHLYSQTQKQVSLLNETLGTLQKTQIQLVQSEKMSSLGQLIAGIAHEINNPVNFIHGNILHADEYAEQLLELIRLYRQIYPQPQNQIEQKIEEIDLEFLEVDLPKLLASIRVGTLRIREIVHSLRIFSRLDEAEVKDVNIHEGIDSTLMILQNRLKDKPDHPAIQVVKEYGQLPLVECYAGQLNQVFMNILSNAVDALDEFNRRRSLQEIQANPSKITITTQTWGKHIAILIADNGPGIDPEVQSRIFDPFFTTKPVGQGTGMGLAISYQIVTERHQGRLLCHSQPGHGTEFTIEIPIHQS